MFSRHKTPRREKHSDDAIKLKKVLGLTTSNAAGLAYDSIHGIIAYPAGCTIVLYDTARRSQNHIISPNNKKITCVAFSKKGKYLVTGEEGHSPKVRVWKVKTSEQLVAMTDHHYSAIKFVAFLKNSKTVLSIGNLHDGMVNIWRWNKSDESFPTLTSRKVSCEVLDWAVSGKGDTFVTVGKREILLWNIGITTHTTTLRNKRISMGSHGNHTFCGVQFGPHPYIFSLTDGGFIFTINSETGRPTSYIELKETPRTRCLRAAGDDLYVGCDNGWIVLFSIRTPESPQFVANLPRPHHLGIDVANPESPAVIDGAVCYPDVIAMAVDSKGRSLSCIYADHSLYNWNVTNPNDVERKDSFLFHSSAICGIDVFPNVEQLHGIVQPRSTFVTCADDNTVRVWSLSSCHDNTFSQELKNIIYFTDGSSNLSTGGENDSNRHDQEKVDAKHSVFSVRVRPGGRHIAAGNQKGCIKIYDVERDMTKICDIGRNDASCVLSIDFTEEKPEKMMASSAQNGYIDIYDTNYKFLSGLEGHSSRVFSVRFMDNANGTYLASCGADRAFQVHRLKQVKGAREIEFQNSNHVSGVVSFYDIAVDDKNHQLFTVCGRKIRVYHPEENDHIEEFNGCVSSDGKLIKLALDPTSQYAATSCSDKSLTFLNLGDKTLLATMHGHSLPAMGVAFLNDGKHLVSASADGCIFVWEIHSTHSKQIGTRIGARNLEGFDEYPTQDTGDVYREPEFSVPGTLEFEIKRIPKPYTISLDPDNATASLAAPKEPPTKPGEDPHYMAPTTSSKNKRRWKKRWSKSSKDVSSAPDRDDRHSISKSTSHLEATGTASGRNRSYDWTQSFSNLVAAAHDDMDLAVSPDGRSPRLGSDHAEMTRIERAISSDMNSLKKSLHKLLDYPGQVQGRREGYSELLKVIEKTNCRKSTGPMDLYQSDDEDGNMYSSSTSL